MLSIKDIHIVETLDTDNLVWKMNTWFNNREPERIAFWNMMSTVIKENPVTMDAFSKVLDDFGIKYQGFVQFAMDNVDGTEEYDQLYVMKKIVDTLKSNKSLNWKI